jgi:hypothetical protein
MKLLTISHSIQLKSSTVRPTSSGWRATCSASAFSLQEPANGSTARRAQAAAERRPAHDSGLISRDLISAAPLHFLLDLRDDVDARSFL